MGSQKPFGPSKLIKNERISRGGIRIEINEEKTRIPRCEWSVKNFKKILKDFENLKRNQKYTISKHPRQPIMDFLEKNIKITAKSEK